MFPNQEPGGRGPPSKNLYQIIRLGSSSSGFLNRQPSKYETPPGGFPSINLRESQLLVMTKMNTLAQPTKLNTQKMKKSRNKNWLVVTGGSAAKLRRARSMMTELSQNVYFNIMYSNIECLPNCWTARTSQEKNSTGPYLSVISFGRCNSAFSHGHIMHIATFCVIVCASVALPVLKFMKLIWGGFD